MLKTTELFINELKERDLKYRDIRTLQDGDDLVEVGFNLDSTRIRIMIFFDASEKSVALRCDTCDRRAVPECTAELQ